MQDQGLLDDPHALLTTMGKYTREELLLLLPLLLLLSHASHRYTHHVALRNIHSLSRLHRMGFAASMDHVTAKAPRAWGALRPAGECSR